MGACTFSTFSRGKTMREAYDKAVKDAIYDHGNDPYNGTISTCNGFIDKTSELKSLIKNSSIKRQAIFEWIGRTEDQTEKHGKCWGAEIKKNEYIFAGWASE